MKKILSILLVLAMVLSLSACAKEHISPKVNYSGNTIPPDMDVAEDKDIKFNFIEMHNYVMEQLAEVYNPFFFIKENEFDIDGRDDDEEKYISITANTLKKTSKQDVDLFVPWILIYISENASVQNFKYDPPATEIDHEEDGSAFNVYTDFGTVFKDYDLKVKITREDGVTLYDLTVKKGQKIPFNSTYIREG